MKVELKRKLKLLAISNFQFTILDNSKFLNFTLCKILNDMNISNEEQNTQQDKRNIILLLTQLFNGTQNGE